MQSLQSPTPERQAIQHALLRVERRLRLNRTLHLTALLAGLLLVGLITWRLLDWLGDAAPAASALVVLLGLLAGIGLVLWLVAALLGRPIKPTDAAGEADRRARLHDELTSAWWFMRDGERPGRAATDWIDLQLRRAARTAGTLQPERLVPLRLSRIAAAALAGGVILLVLTWSAKPLEPTVHEEASGPAPVEDGQVRAMRELVEGLPKTEARRRLESALQTLESGSATPQERQRALAQAQDAVDQIRMDAAGSREGLQRLSQMLAGQKGLEEVADALAKGDAKRAADLLAKVQADNPAAPSGNSPQPSEALGDRPIEQAVQQLTDAMAEPQGARPTDDALKASVERLNEIAKQLAAANYVNEAWKQVKGPQLQASRAGQMTAGKFDQQQMDGAANNSSPNTGDKPMGGGTMFRSAAVAQGNGTEEQEGGTRMGDAVGTAQSDPVLGDGGERLDAQLKQQALTGQEAQQPDQEQSWFYAESQKRDARSEWRSVQARARFTEAEAGTAGGISVRHRQIVKDYFMNRPEAEK